MPQHSSKVDSTEAASEAFRQLRTKLTNHNPAIVIAAVSHYYEMNEVR